MAKEIPTVLADQAHFLKGHASWLYCDSCNKTVAYLCYVTYRYFRFSFTCSCGASGSVENRFGDIDLNKLALGTLQRSEVNKRYICEKDASALFSVVPKNIQSYKATVVCASCDTRYEIEENFM
ncbi:MULTISPECIES: hypothetical protein [unclassified Breznakia]|uniref:hypothetical protein n=1 Tax=unclassified Breznakia TaxID=2623764 RepID=UPI002474F276|nr:MULTISPECIES: hypothetical protein [unclassified Breznakia]MDH6367915.1 transcription elongation factor Elf1 [Breznakia sp. PH1-1]MDH6405022.1 transcription elongation factor Elf1 [Breznakia sp. PF1-11]MDH6412718.1 transcription elongation factor Elf1 [Breznakia sp. PFB1-11]MDH6415097.1 transcription elongation factor Elf1 [Breznakia sp. PFB1-14]MDH6417389.1 transcription elongation factor Elf1 [Breznakia sp. PFB1-4]